MINVVIPMAGAGSRFATAGYEKPKPFINVNGSTMIEHVLENLKDLDARFILIARKEHAEHEQETIIKIQQKYNAEFIMIDKLTEGAACTVLYSHRLVNSADPLLIANSDQIVDLSLIDYVKDMHKRNLSGSILTFTDNDPKWSFARIDEMGYVTEVREKEVISEFATVGIYLFKQGKYFVEAAMDMIINNDRVKNEFYVCPVYNYMIEQGLKIGIYNIPMNAMHGTGTPDDLNNYLKKITSV